MDCPLQVRKESLPQVEEFKYLEVLFTSEGKMERKFDGRIGGAVGSYVDAKAMCVVKEVAESEDKYSR